MAQKVEAGRMSAENSKVYDMRRGGRQVWRAGVNITRRTITRLMQCLGVQGGFRSKPLRTAFNDKEMPCPLDRVNHLFKPLANTGRFAPLIT